MTMATRTGFACSDTAVVGSNPARDMDVCVRLFCLCCRRLATGWSTVQGVLQSGQDPSKVCTVINERIKFCLSYWQQVDCFLFISRHLNCMHCITSQNLLKNANAMFRSAMRTSASQSAVTKGSMIKHEAMHWYCGWCTPNLCTSFTSRCRCCCFWGRDPTCKCHVRYSI
jgi:hypothetical protein